MDSNQIQTNGNLETNSLIDRFNRIYSTNPTSLYGSQFNFNYQYLRPQLYSEYDVMDQDAIIASALDIIADESTLKMTWVRYYKLEVVMKISKKYFIIYFMMF